MRISVRLPAQLIPHWWRVAYKVTPWLDDEMYALAQMPVDENFERVVSEHVRACIEDGKMPPPEIASAVLNLANDLVDGRDMVIRTGDYIAIQKYLRGGKG